LTRTIRACEKLAQNSRRHVHRQSERGAGSGARRRAGGRYTEGGGSNTPIGVVASDDLGQHSATGDEAGEKKKMELHDFL
jgi:hypothetical protein